MELLALLFTVGLVVKFWWVIAAVVGLVVAAHWTRLAVDRHFARAAAERYRLSEIVKRADRQHDWVIQGDSRGIYGEYPVAGI
jgi:hypothetical protein